MHPVIVYSKSPFSSYVVIGYSFCFAFWRGRGAGAGPCNGLWYYWFLNHTLLVNQECFLQGTALLALGLSETFLLRSPRVTLHDDIGMPFRYFQVVCIPCRRTPVTLGDCACHGWALPTCLPLTGAERLWKLLALNHAHLS